MLIVLSSRGKQLVYSAVTVPTPELIHISIVCYITVIQALMQQVFVSLPPSQSINAYSPRCILFLYVPVVKPGLLL